ncbi:MAG: type II secretion system F family protein, partial [Pirellulales bacterium]|nr:type II secretion system F family protein [Pirellulales bacterium]
ETQLADTIDILVASVQAGSSLQSALDQAAANTSRPLRGELEELVARLRLGDQPGDVFELLRQRVRLETFRLFSTTLTVNWQVGGGLSETLAAVGQTIRGRLTIARQIRALSAQGRITTLSVLAVTWFLAAMMWQSDPARFEGFLGSALGSWLVSGALAMQGVGILMVARISRPKV